MKKSLFGIVCAVVLFGVGHCAKADVVYVSGTITSNTTWSDENTYVVTSSGATINSGVTLQIEAGTVVKFKNGTSLNVTGVLDAEGESGNEIYFTSAKDDSVDGDTNGDGSATTPAIGDWSKINLNNGSTATIKHAVIRYNGGGSPSAAFFNYYATLTLEDSIVASTTTYVVNQQYATTTITGCDLTASSTKTALYLYHGHASISSSQIHGNNIGVDAMGTGTLTLNGNTFTSNTKAANVNLTGGLLFSASGNTGSGGFYLSGSLGASQTLTDAGLPYVIAAEFTVGKVLDIGPGAVFKLSSDIYVYGSGAALRAIGTATQPITFTSIHDDAIDGIDTDGTSTAPAAGDWDRIKVMSSASSTIAHALIRYAGLGSYGSISLSSSGKLSIEDTEVATSSNYGIRQDSGTATFVSVLVHNTTRGIYVSGGAAKIDQAALHHNSYGLYASGGTVNLTNSTFCSNTTDKYTTGSTFTESGNLYGCSSGLLKSGTITADEEWTASTAPYVIALGGVEVAPGVTLTIDPGVVVKFAGPAAKLTINGALNAQGTSGNKIYFTSIHDDAADGNNTDATSVSPSAGDWNTIKFDDDSSATITNALVRFGGSGSHGSLYNNGGALLLDTSVVRHK